MTDKKSSKVCEAEGNTCKKEAQALCYHCSENLCRAHFIQHAQVIQEKTRTDLHSFADKLNELSSRFNELSISDDILQKPLDEIEKWRVEAREKIDEIAENKRRKLNDVFHKYRRISLIKNDEQLVKLGSAKKVLAELIQEADASATQISDLQTSINEAQKYLNALNTPVINVIARSSNLSVDICTNFFDVQSTSINDLRKFKITYIRLNGIVQTYSNLTKKDGKMSDLKNSFVQEYRYCEEFSQSAQSLIDTTNHDPKCDSILPVKIYQHCAQQQYVDETILSNILECDMIVFYETPYSLSGDSPRILMPCLFRCNLDNKPFGLPIYLNVPRKRCRGQDVRDALHDTLGNFFPHNLSIKQLSYDTYLQSTVNNLTKETKLDDVLQDGIDFSKVITTLIVTFDSQFVDAYEQHYLGQFGF